MIRFFRGSGIGPVLLLTLSALALWIQFLISPPRLTDVSGSDPMPLWGLIANALEGSPLLAAILSFALLLIVAIVMVRFNTSIFFIPRRTYLPALIYIILYALFPGEMVLNPALPAALLILAGMWRMVSSYRVNGMTFNFFDAALLISSAGMFYAGAIWFIILVLIGALILRSPDSRELTVTIAGALLPWILLYAIWYVTGGDVGDLSEIIRHNLFDDVPPVQWGRTLVILLAMTGLNILPSLGALISEMPTYKIRSRKTFELFVWMIVLCIAVYIFIPSVSAEMNAITALPVAFIMANYYAFTRRLTAAEIFFWLMVVMLIISRLWPY
ncbi:MAG: DUF6427 family protein [Bacteroidales bacterium]|nr:DUF6427 family protein [Bacteroidales bacterium]